MEPWEQTWGGGACTTSPASCLRGGGQRRGKPPQGLEEESLGAVWLGGRGARGREEGEP